MKRFTLLLFALFGALSLSFSQTGNGVLILAEPTFEFGQTTVDSTATLTLQLKNAVGAAQTIYFGGLDAPFSLADNTPIEIPSQDTVEVVLNFTPAAVGSFSDTLEVIGNIFGSAQLIVSGQGIQVQLEWSTFEVQFDTTAIGATSYADVTVTNVGDGVAYLSPQSEETGLFSVEFVDDWVDPGMPEPCATIDGINFYPFTLTINPSVYGFNGFGNFNAQLRPVNYYDQIEDQDDNTTSYINLTIDSWTGGQWYVEYPYQGYSEYVDVGTQFEVCLPVTSEGEEHFYWYVHSDDCNFAGTYLSLTDAYGFQSWESPSWDGISLNYCDWGSGYQGYSDLEVTIPSAPAFTPGELQEGETQIARFSFSPVDAGAVDGVVSISTNSPLLPQADINCSGTGVSEVSGELCDLTWTLSNSPYTLVGDVVVPAGCTLNINPGVAVIGGEYDITVNGHVNATSTDGNTTTNISCLNLTINGSGTFIGTSNNNVVLTTDAIISHTQSSNLEFSHCQISQSNETISNVNCLDAENCVQLEIEEWNSEWKDSSGWDVVFSSYGGSQSSTLNYSNDYYLLGNDEYSYESNGSGSYLHLRRNCCYDSDWFEMGIQSQEISLLPGDESISISFDAGQGDYWSDNKYVRVYVSLDGGSFQLVSNSEISCCSNGDSSSFSHFTATINSEQAQTMRVRIMNRVRYYASVFLDNIDVDIPHVETNLESVADFFTLSSGGITLENSIIGGGFRTLSTTDTIQIENCIFDGQQNFAVSNKGGFVSMSNSEIYNSCQALNLSGEILLVANTITDNFTGCVFGDNSDVNIFESVISGNSFIAIQSGNNSSLNLDFNLIDGNNGPGVVMGGDGQLNLSNCRLHGNGEEGILSASPVFVNHCSIAYNGGTGLVLTGNNFHTLNNSILWGNNSSNYTQIDIGGGVISTSYSTLQGRSSYGTTGSGQYYWGEGVIEADPLFADDDLHLEIFSPCVDGGQPWHQDAHMPYGLGGVRADMGMYGGPDNAYWGGDALPDGASVLSGVSDSPQDQGGVVGLVFDASFYDNSDLVNNVTSYAFWRHYDPTGGSIGSLDEGNWELIGEMPAQSFNGYAYQAPTLGNTNSFGTFNSCYTVVAHTDDEDTYWYSNVMCGESVDNLAPVAPEVNGLVVEGVGAQISWEAPLEPDYAYTEITNPDGYLAELGTDTVVVDPGIALGEEVTYTVRHFDVNGNASPAVELTLLAQPGLDIIPLAAGWNLISTDRMPADASAQAVFSGLASGNLQYVTGFDGGVTFFDPDGFQFLNSLEAIEGGKGYWVKVLEADTLEVAGAVLGAGFESALTSGWNLIGYAPAAPTSPESFFNELIASGELEYVTGFDGGSQFFDPNGLPFLNSLEALKNGFGYWVKVAADYNPNGMAPTGETKSTPTFMLINGTTNLPALAGSTMEVINEAGESVATAEVIAGGYIMTTPLFGDDPSTSGFEGLELGEVLRFIVNGMLAAEAIEFTAGMDLKKLSLTFPEAAQHLAVFPNPASDRLTISGTSPANTKVSIQILDPTGRVVLAHDLVSSVNDWSYEVPAVSELAAGLYSVRVTEADGSASTVTWVRE